MAAATIASKNAPPSSSKRSTPASRRPDPSRSAVLAARTWQESRLGAFGIQDVADRASGARQLLRRIVSRSGDELLRRRRPCLACGVVPGAGGIFASADVPGVFASADVDRASPRVRRRTSGGRARCGRLAEPASDRIVLRRRDRTRQHSQAQSGMPACRALAAPAQTEAPSSAPRPSAPRPPTAVADRHVADRRAARIRPAPRLVGAEPDRVRLRDLAQRLAHPHLPGRLRLGGPGQVLHERDGVAMTARLREPAVPGIPG
jgi:hypothetical protein